MYQVRSPLWISPILFRWSYLLLYLRVSTALYWRECVIGWTSMSRLNYFLHLDFAKIRTLKTEGGTKLASFRAERGHSLPFSMSAVRW